MRNLVLVLAILTLSVASVAAQKNNEPIVKEAPTTEVVDSQIHFFGGATNVRLSNAFVLAVGSLNINVSPLSRIPIRRGRVTFPITSGTLDAANLRGEILHSNGLIFQRGSASVRIEGFAITTLGVEPSINGLASANGSVVDRIPLFDLDLSNAEVGRFGNFVTINNVGVTLSAAAAGALNAVFETTAFTEGFNIGTASVTGFTLNSH